MLFRCFQILIKTAYPSSFPKRMKDALQIHLEDSYLDGNFRIFHLFDILASGFKERIASELRLFRLSWRNEPRSVLGLVLLIPWNLFLILILASLFLGGPGWLKFFRNFPYERNGSAEFFLPALLVSAGIVLMRDLIFLKTERSVFKRYSYLFYINMSLIVPFFLILIL
ncbi:hypothetical protein [Leptospira kmetyi]|uniref:hypothetical protein n=1 Tax=Leptospira kmetyi TaxID=408139 RepID=UPI00039058C5|nr:hypothetical protein [Leptospira kmetyi]EQA51730.1 hypothetical protein LEP1GSC052_3070 [Leptospira kmetyi serovar Malaysia str. Bejo-Iso9]